MHQLYDVRNEETLSYDPHGFALLFTCGEASVLFGRILPGHRGLDARSRGDAEDDAYVLSGMLSYPTAQNNEVFVPKGSWVVARPGEVFGYWNKGGKPVTLFAFRPVTSRRSQSGSQRIYKPNESRAVKPGGMARVLAYETPSSRGEMLTLHPGEPSTLEPRFCVATFVLAGRIMALFGREKISLDAGEGLAFVRERVEIVGVGGLSSVLVFSTAL